MQVMLIATNTRFPTRDVEVTVELREQVGLITRIAERLTFVIPKPYPGISTALEYECAVFLHQQGFDVSVPDVAPDDLLPDQGAGPSVL